MSLRMVVSSCKASSSFQSSLRRSRMVFHNLRSAARSSAVYSDCSEARIAVWLLEAKVCNFLIEILKAFEASGQRLRPLSFPASVLLGSLVELWV